jgi:hypothetical protein
LDTNEEIDMCEERGSNVDFCLGKESREASNYEELLKHVGHKIQVVSFPRGINVLKVAMECVTCNRVLIEFDNPDYAE